MGQTELDKFKAMLEELAGFDEDNMTRLNLIEAYKLHLTYSPGGELLDGMPVENCLRCAIRYFSNNDEWQHFLHAEKVFIENLRKEYI